MPLHLGGMGDPFQPAERRLWVSLQYLRAVSPLSLSPGDQHAWGTIADRPYHRFLKDLGTVVVRLSLSTTEDLRSSLVERRRSGHRPSYGQWRNLVRLASGSHVGGNLLYQA